MATYSSELYDYIIKTGQIYRQQDCFNLCLQELALKNCQCYFTVYQNLNTTLRPCLNLSDIECGSRQYINLNLNECQTKYCPLECDTIRYDLTLSSLAFNHQYEFFNEFKYSNVIFQVYYSSTQYTLLTESPKMSLADLFSQIGGALGLFISFSIFTLFELMELLILFIFRLLL